VKYSFKKKKGNEEGRAEDLNLIKPFSLTKKYRGQRSVLNTTMKSAKSTVII